MVLRREGNQNPVAVLVPAQLQDLQTERIISLEMLLLLPAPLVSHYTRSINTTVRRNERHRQAIPTAAGPDLVQGLED